MPAPYGGSAIKVKNEQDLPPHFSYTDYERMLFLIEDLYSPNYATRNKLIFRLMFETGGRVNDIADLKVSDFNLQRKLLKLRVRKKDNSIEIPISDDLLVNVVNYWRVFNIKEQMFVTKDTVKKGFKKRGTHLSSVMIWKIVKHVGEELGIGWIHPHTFRHSLAIHLLSKTNGYDGLIAISARLGHSSITTTINYYLVMTPEIQRAILKGTGIV